MNVSKRVRFEIFKRDGFTCRYCGRKSPQVVLELDHIVPISQGGHNDPMNLATSCYDCNRGKSDKMLSEIITGEDPHDRALEILEKERQLKEYEIVLEQRIERIENDLAWLLKQWRLDEEETTIVRNSLEDFSAYDLDKALRIAYSRTNGYGKSFIRYYCGIMRKWREAGNALG